MAFASLRGMAVTEVMDFVKYILLVLMIYTYVIVKKKSEFCVKFVNSFVF